MAEHTRTCAHDRCHVSVFKKFRFHPSTVYYFALQQSSHRNKIGEKIRRHDENHSAKCRVCGWVSSLGYSLQLSELNPATISLGSRGARLEQTFRFSLAIDRDRQPTFVALLALLITCTAGQ